MRDAVVKMWIEISKVIGVGFFVGFVIGGVIGVQVTEIMETTIQIVYAFLSYALSGGMLGATLAACVVLFVAGMTFLSTCKEKSREENG